MRIFLDEGTGSGFRPIAGPGDLAGRRGTVRIVDEPKDTDTTRAFWAVPLGCFAVMGGAVLRRST